MTAVAIVAVVDIILIAIAFAIALGSKASQRRELRRLQDASAAVPAIAGRHRAEAAKPY
jgi:hypothetical protein